MIVKLLTEHHLELLSLKGSSESTLIKMPHCWKSHVKAHIQNEKRWRHLRQFVRLWTSDSFYMHAKLPGGTTMF